MIMVDYDIKGKDRKELICNLFISGYSINKISSVTGHCLLTINRTLDEEGLKTITKRKRTLPYKFLDLSDNLPDQELGYICGVIATDGSLEYNSQNICICCEVNDGAYLREISLKLIGKDICKYYPTSKTLTFKAALPKLYQYCLDMGITPCKSLTLDVKLDDKSDEFKWAFLKGTIDGDGTVTLDKTPGRSSISIISASEVFLTTLKRVYRLGRIQKTTSGYQIIRYSGECLKELINYLPLIGLDRKNQRIMAFSEHDQRTLRSGGSKTNLLDGFTYSIPYEGKLYSLLQLNKLFNVVRYPTALARVQRGWDIVEALTFPVSYSNSRHAKKYGQSDNSKFKFCSGDK